MKKKIILIFTGIIICFFFTIFLDRFLGVILNRTGYFLAMTPSTTEVHQTSEFSVTNTISAQGIRNKIVDIPKPKDTYRILVVGDSFVFGYGVQEKDSWVRKLEKNLQYLPKKIELINAGKPGTEATASRQICSAYADRFDIDAIVWGLYNDDLLQAVSTKNEESGKTFQKFFEQLWPTLTRIGKRYIAYDRFPGVKNGEKVYTQDHESTFTKKFLSQNPSKLLKIPAKFRNDFINGKINSSLISQALEHPNAFNYYLENGAMDSVVRAMDKNFSFLKEQCTHSRPVFVVFIPGTEAVSAYYHTFKKELGFTVDKNLASISFDTYLSPIVKKYGFYYISPLEDFRSDGCKECYYPYDQHFTKKGNQRMAEYLTPFFKDILSQKL